MPVRPVRPIRFEAPKCSHCGCARPHTFCHDQAAPVKQGSMLAAEENPPEENDDAAILVSGGKSGMYWTLRRDLRENRRSK